MDVMEECLVEMAQERRERAERLPFFDAGLWLGRPEGFPWAQEVTLEQLPEILGNYFITGGLISHWRGQTVSAQEGNRSLQVALENVGDAGAKIANCKWKAVWTGLPLFPREADPVPGRGAVPGWVRAVRLFPRSHHFPLEEWCVGSLCDWLLARRMPLFLWHTEVDWPSLFRLAQACPDLPIVVETQTQKILYHTRPLLALMRACPNVSVELSNFAGQGFLEYAVQEFGAERLLFGSFLPVNDPWVPIGLILDAQISDEEKALIAGENLRRLVDRVQL